MDCAKIVLADWMSCGAAMLVGGGWGPEMFFKSVSKCSAILSYIIMI